MKYVIVQGNVVPAKVAPFLRKILPESGASLQSVYRGADADALLHRLGKHSQADLYNCWVRRQPGCNPANPPGHSTHELRSDGVAFPHVKSGGKLPWWAVGIDVDDAHVKAFIHAAAKHGWVVFRPYPNDRREYHHVNFRKPPVMARVKAAVKSAVPNVRRPARLRKLSTDGVNLIAGFEGFRGSPYNDAAGYATVGFGHLIRLGSVRSSDKPVTRVEALALLRKDAGSAAAAVRKLVKVRLYQREFDALVSFVFNVGAGAFASSSLLKKLNSRNYIGAANELLKWDRAGGRQLPGLLNRREAERRHFLH